MIAQSYTVIIVDDDTNSQDVARQVIELDHPEAMIHTAQNGVDCLLALESVTPDLIVMDLSMPGMDGWQTLATIRSEPEWAMIPIIAMTAYHSSRVAEDARQSGFNAYFPKPLDLPAFRAYLAGMS